MIGLGMVVTGLARRRTDKRDDYAMMRLVEGFDGASRVDKCLGTNAMVI
jgi:hypothetical protein